MLRYALAWWRHSWQGLMLGLILGLIAWLVSLVPVVRGIEDWMLDGCFSLRGARPTHTRVVLIGLDEPSLRELHKPLVFTSPDLAEAVSYLHQAGVQAIGLDFSVPGDLMTIADLQPGKSGDATKLGMAIAQAGNVVLPESQSGDGKFARPILQWQYKSLLNPQPTDFGFTNLTEDDDGFLRRQQLYVVDASKKAHMQFGLALLAMARGEKVEWKAESQRLYLGDEAIPLDANQKMLINFVGPPGTFEVIPFRDILAAARTKKPLEADLADAIAVIGITAPDQQDIHSTPYTNNYSRYLFAEAARPMLGPEIHANIIATIGDRAFIPGLGPVASLLLLLATGAVLGHLFARMSLVWGAVVALVHHFAWKGVALAAFWYANWRLDVVAMLLLGAMAYAAAFALRWWRLRRMFGIFKSEAIARKLSADPASMDLAGEERVATILFADIRDFTHFSEQHTAHEVVALLNGYFSAIVPLIDAHQGTLNQYIGDGIMVIYGAPTPAEDHALQAVRTAVAMVERVHQMQAEWAQLGNPKFRIGVGIHTGKVVVGTVGSRRRLDYTAIGDTVNAAARIESENKPRGTEILISSATYAELPEEERRRLGCCADADPASVKGKDKPLYLHEVRVPAGVLPEVVGVAGERALQ